MTDRLLSVVVHNWSAVAAQLAGAIDASVPVVVLHANRVVSATPAARDFDVVDGLRKREAQSRCPQAVVVAHDPSRDARLFMPVVDAISRVGANLEIIEPGVVVLPAKGPARFFGGEANAVQQIRQAAIDVLGESVIGIGIGNGPSAAQIAAMADLIVPDEVDASTQFLSSLPVRALVDADLGDLLVQLGITTLGMFAALPAADVLARFGRAGANVHLLARGIDDRQLNIHRAPPGYVQRVEFDPPSELVEPVVFCVRQPSELLVDQLSTLGLRCRSLAITAHTEHGETLVRTWRHGVGFGATQIVERIRWQLDGWINGTIGDGSDQPTSGISLVQIDPIEVIGEGGYQPAFWGGASANDDRAAQGFARVVGLCGSDAVHVVQSGGGRGVEQSVALVSWSSGIQNHPSAANHPSVRRTDQEMWSGSLPAPHPLVVYPTPLTATLVDVDNQIVDVSGDAQLSAEPHALCFGDVAGRRVAIASWAGPWPVQERWWDARRRKRYARLQVVDESGTAYVVQRANGQWFLTAMYD